MNNLAVCIVALGAMLLGLILTVLGRALGLQHQLGPCLVRGKRYVLDLLDGRRTIDWTQAAILILGALGAALVAWGDESARWGFIVSLAGQPFWLRATWRARQWGMLALSIWFTGVWAFGAVRALGGA